MKDAWTAFTQGAEGREAVGYFEAAPRPGSPTGRAVSFLSASEIRTITPRASPQEEGRHVERFLPGAGGSRGHGLSRVRRGRPVRTAAACVPGRGPLSTRDVRARGSPYPRSCRSAGAPEGGPLRTRRGQAPPRLAPVAGLRPQCRSPRAGDPERGGVPGRPRPSPDVETTQGPDRPRRSAPGIPSGTHSSTTSGSATSRSWGPPPNRSSRSRATVPTLTRSPERSPK